MNKQEVIYKLIETLQHVIKRPTMYMGRATWDAVNTFIYGFSYVYGAVGIPMTLALRSQATSERGWVFNSIRGADQMRAQDLSEEQIVQELLRIEIKML